ncbi:MAG: hypothetical protein JST80_12815 [Bdellovibrionales bacterium]|nr:hypothetical protein [Bdellovibrionales bacterium]
MKNLILLAAVLLGSQAHAQPRVNTISFDLAPDRAVYFGVSPVTSQLKLESTSSAGYTNWGFSISGGYQSTFLDLFDTRLSASFQRLSGANNLNTVTNHEDVVSSGVDAQLCVLLFKTACIGGGVQRRSISLVQTNGTTVQDFDVSGWLPFARATYDLIGAGEDNSLGLGLSIAYYSGTLETVKATDLQASIALNYIFGIR